MAVHCLSLSHHHTPLPVRERVAFSRDQLLGALEVGASRRNAGTGSLQEMAILSTCNRTELYMTAESPTVAVAAGRGFLAESLGVDIEVIGRYDVPTDGDRAVRHLARVAAGLESMVLGESEILGQVAEAIRLASGAGASGTALDRVFRTAMRAGKRARTETAIGKHPASVGSVWVHLAGDTLGSLAGRHATVIGAGRMARKAVKVLRSRDAATITVISRRLEQGRQLVAAAERSVGFESLGRALAESDIVVCATSASQPLITSQLVTAVRGGTPAPLVIVDIGIPRNVHPDVRAIAGVQVIDMDDIQRSLENSVDHRRGEVPAVEAIVEDEARRYRDEDKQDGLLPILDAVRRKAEDSRRSEVTRFVDRLPHVPAELREEIEALSRSLVNTILAAPSQCLRKEATNGRAEEFARVTRELFEITVPELPDEVDPGRPPSVP
jgi:glutamyl-tRNA reductase